MLQKLYVAISFNKQDSHNSIALKIKPHNIPSQPKEAAKLFLLILEQTIKDKNASPNSISLAIFNLYQMYFPQSKNLQKWPDPTEIEKQFSIQLNMATQTLYNELLSRHKFAHYLKSNNQKDITDMIEKNWDNYSFIFQSQSKSIPFHPIVTWEICENFLNQFAQIQASKTKLINKGCQIEKYFNISQIRNAFQDMRKGINNLNKNDPLTAQHIFGFYGILTLSTAQLFLGNFTASLQAVELISFDFLKVYTKCFGATLMLCLTVSYNYFMLSQYRKSLALSEMFVFFILKNKKHLSGIYNSFFEKNYDRIVGLLCLDYIFLEQTPHPTILEAFKGVCIKSKERIFDIYNKLKQRDETALTRLYTEINMVVVKQEFQRQKKDLMMKFKAMESISLTAIVQNYTQIKVEKIAKLLNVPIEKVQPMLNMLTDLKFENSPWDTTIMKPLIAQRKIPKVEIQDGIVKINQGRIGVYDDQEIEWPVYLEELKWLSEKMAVL